MFTSLIGACVISAIPLLPASSAAQIAPTSWPSDEMLPMPVTATRMGSAMLERMVSVMKRPVGRSGGLLLLGRDQALHPVDHVPQRRELEVLVVLGNVDV